ncbi:MAG: M14 family zinc carboxypeptidase [Bacteroidota bacterium]
MKRLVAAAGVLIMAVASVVGQDRHSQVRIPVNSVEDVRRVARLGIPVDHTGGRAGRWLDLFLSSREVELLERNGIPFTVLIQNWEEHYRRRQREESLRPSLPALASAVKHFHLGSMGGFLTLQEIRAELDSMRSEYPHLITERDSIGVSVENRPLWAMKISAHADLDETEPRALYDALTHAGEPGGMMQLIYFMWYLLENYGTDPEVTHLLDHRELFFIPVVNPDGYLYNEISWPDGGGQWRKNRRDNGDGSIGVDLNRNYEFAWGYDNEGSSPNGVSDVYRGPRGFSEPETRTVRDFCVEKGFSTALNYHTYGNLLIYPWGYLDGDTMDSTRYRAMAEEMTSANRYTYGTGGQTVGYITNGDADDWMYGETLLKPRIVSMTPEVGSVTDGHWPSVSRILPHAQENLFANLYLAHAAGQFLTIADAEVEQESSSDTIRIQLSFVSAGMVVPASTAQLSVASTYIRVIDSSFSSFEWEDPMSIRALPNTSYTPGDHARLIVELSYVGGYTVDTVQIRLGAPALLYADDAESSMANWEFATDNPSARWDTSSGRAHSGLLSYTESPAGVYPDNLTTTMTLRSPLVLSGTGAELRFWAMWDIETNWDYAVVEVSTDGQSWNPLRGRYTAQGSGRGKQPLFSPGLDGIKHAWAEEVMDLEEFLGQSVQLRFRFESDGYVGGEGIFVDDIRLLLYTSLTDVGDELPPDIFSLRQNYPNPFNPATTIRYSLPRRGHVMLKVFDLLGREVETLVDEVRSAGAHSVRFDAGGLAAGVYLYRLTAGGGSQTRKLLLLR